MRGFWRTVEAVIAAITIMIFLVTAGNAYYASNGGVSRAPPGHEMLKELDDMNALRPLAAARDFGAINELIDVPGFMHDVRICDFRGTCWGNQTGAWSSSRNVAVSGYVVSGFDSYDPVEIRLYMWRTP
jgi:hypothetical protein